jgi:hypothetical protein
VDCLSPRSDEKVCCSNWEWASPLAKGFCHDPSQPSVQYSRYTTCESACKRDENDYMSYYSLCKDPSNGARKDVMTQVPADSDVANKKKWCECVELCLQCTGNNGGIGERPFGMATNLNPSYTSIHGTCAPPPDSWSRPSTENSQPATPSAGSTAPEATDYRCAADNNPGTILCALLQPRYSPGRELRSCVVQMSDNTCLCEGIIPLILADTQTHKRTYHGTIFGGSSVLRF